MRPNLANDLLGNESNSSEDRLAPTSSLHGDGLTEPFFSVDANAPTYKAAQRKAGPQTRARTQAAWPAASFRYRTVKRAVDLLIVLLAMPILLPILLLVAALVRFTSPGPVFFSHRRISMNGAFFSMWKFRTMSVDSTERLELYLARHPEARLEWSKHHKLRNDPRVTSIGFFLRRFSLDELPQVWNVMTGRMSLVGPTSHRGRRGGKIWRVLRLLLPRQARRNRPMAGLGTQHPQLPGARTAGLRLC